MTYARLCVYNMCVLACLNNNTYYVAADDRFILHKCLVVVYLISNYIISYVNESY